MEYSLKLLDTTLDGGLVERISHWEPEASRVPDAALDSRLREGNTYLERSALGVSLDSGLMEGRSGLEPLEQLVLGSSLAARPIEGIKIKSIRLEAGDKTGSGQYPGRSTYGGDCLPGAFGSGVSLDSGLMKGMSCTEPLEQSVLGALLVVRPEETDTPERPALASQTNHKQACFKLSARPMPDTDIVHNTDVNTDIKYRPAGEFSSDDYLELELVEMEYAAVSAGTGYPG